MSPGNKNSRHGIRAFVTKAAALLRAGVHLLLIDLFPPGPRDPQGIHKAVWDEVCDSEFTLPADRRLTLAAYIGGPLPPDLYVPVPLESTYQAAWDAVPTFWRDAVSGPISPNPP